MIFVLVVGVLLAARRAGAARSAVLLLAVIGSAIALVVQTVRLVADLLRR